MTTQTKRDSSAQKKKSSFSFFFSSSSSYLVVLKAFPFKIGFASITTLQNGNFYLLFSFVSGNEAENESQIESELLHRLAGWFSAVYLESKRGLWTYYPEKVTSQILTY